MNVTTRVGLAGRGFAQRLVLSRELDDVERGSPAEVALQERVLSFAAVGRVFRAHREPPGGEACIPCTGPRFRSCQAPLAPQRSTVRSMSSRSFAAALSVFVLLGATDAHADELAAPIVVARPPHGVTLLMEVLFGRSFRAITNGRELAVGGVPELRQPQWTGLEAPRPPPLYVRLVRITF
jgi:hypothetical protein